MSDIAIKVESVSKIYKLYDKPIDRMKESLSLRKKSYSKEHYALNNISFEIERGETVGIIGTNGSGKSTILKIITGVLNASKGNVIVNGRISALLELGAGFNQEYTGIQNIYLNGTMLGFTKEEIDAKVESIVDFADIGDFINQPVKTYSSGMFVRLAFAVAINIEPEILIVDEALSVGDVFFQAKCYRKFEEFKKQGKTILFVSHDLGSIGKYCDRAILINKGTKLIEGETKEVIDIYKKVLVNQLGDECKSDYDNNKVFEDGIWKKSMNINPNKIEYGNKLAEIVDFAVIDSNGIITNNVVKGELFSIKMKIIFNEIIQDPIFAFTIKDLKGTDITGTNTMLEKINISISKVGEIKEVTFTQKMNLQGREHLLSLGCTGFKDGDFTVYHRLYDVCNITVIATKNSVGYYDMDSEVRIK
ncbi:ABC transporter ATP-binding protein [Clostridium beijerinckii]|uniref:ABC transporter ATP-binding protein n=1 Tax=Clostridium beijerinckii TaxID=1520 RepID=A0AB74VEZ5_CLOBE|nr:ABC transporter ATP-binding protein [Clostridium beijerinckii]NRZ29280.1 teichoic acid transport system ATP-binding protein [Clostridium beijerinckii]NYB94950.1 teichoic acid transport system ATP-binding protein [Clostridium beijerinckii]OOM25734.1 teichoic acids export ATP-binding protein TagH [Clostridium beijerinckii]QUN34920.1 ABC transporter ATP-binding protein [Clostridium beijerinckii]SQB00098.1 ABC transporter [Clostridium beijerinckii]